MNLNDQLLSLRHHLYTLYETRIENVVTPATNKMRILTEGRVKEFTRPLWRIERLSHRVVDLGYTGYRDDCQWLLTYYPVNRLDADETLNTLKLSLEQGGENKKRIRRISAWRFNWQYPQPTVRTYVVSPGGIAPGSYSIRVSGVDECDTESAASVPLTVVLQDGNNAFRIRIHRQPFVAPVFKSYKVYVNNKLEATLNESGKTHMLGGTPQIVLLTSLNANGVAPKELSISNPIRWKFIRVNTYSDDIREDRIKDGEFIASVTMETSVYMQRERLQPDVIGEIVVQSLEVR